MIFLAYSYVPFLAALWFVGLTGIAWLFVSLCIGLPIYVLWLVTKCISTVSGNGKFMVALSLAAGGVVICLLVLSIGLGRG